MKAVWKALGLAALAAGLTPYRVTTDEETGDVKLRALLWKGTYGHRAGNHGLTLDLGLFLPTEEEPHLYADELVVHYHNGQPCCVSDEESCCCGEAGEGQEGAPKACCCQEQASPAAPEAQADSVGQAGQECPAPDVQAGEDAPENHREP